MSSSNNTSIWPIVWVVVGVAVVLQMLANNNTPAPAPTVNSNSFEYRYAKERFKQEGFSNAESATAAEAVVKFHEAQKARNR